MKNFSSGCGIALAVLLLGGCGSLLNDDEKAPLPGERISVLQLQQALSPSPELENKQIVLPEPWTNQLWPQSGGYPTHAMGHLSLGNDLKRAWSVSVGAGGSVRRPITAVPVVADSHVFALDAEGTVSAFDVDSGKRKWRRNIVPKGERGSGAIGGGVSYDAGTVYAVTGFKNLVALDAQTGDVKFSIDTPAPARAAPTVMDGRIYLTTIDNRLMVYAATDGTPLWRYLGVGETTNLLGGAVVAADDALVVLPLSTGEVFGLNPVDGRVFWQDNLASVRRTGTLSSIADIRSLPVIDQGIVYAVNYSGRMVAIDAQTGRRLWQREIGSSETPWPAGESVFLVTADQQLIALDRMTGGIHWVTDLPRGKKNDLWTGPVLAGGRLILANSAGEMAAFNPADGQLLVTRNIGDRVLLPPVVSGNTLYILGANGRLSAYR